MFNLKEIKRRVKEYGAISPSSPFLARQMVKSVLWPDVKLAVELGAGSGVITKEALKKLSPNAMLVVFEINPRSYHKLSSIKDSRLIVINDRAENMDKYLNGEKADCIISGVPIGALSVREFDLFASAVKRNLKTNSQFVQFQYFLTSYFRVQREFPEIAISFVPINLPPAFVYVCR